MFYVFFELNGIVNRSLARGDSPLEAMQHFNNGALSGSVFLAMENADDAGEWYNQQGINDLIAREFTGENARESELEREFFSRRSP